eukprot:g2109.t1
MDQPYGSLQVSEVSSAQLVEPILSSSDKPRKSLSDLKGVVIRQVSQWADLAQFAGLPIELANKYKISELPLHVDGAAKHPLDPDRWQPNDGDLDSLPPRAIFAEESNPFLRGLLVCCGGLNARPLKMHYSTNGDREPSHTLHKPCRLGGLCCCPWETTLRRTSDGKVVGRTKENFTGYPKRCFQLCCLGTSYTDVFLGESNDPSWTLRSSVGLCCGRVNNCCGSTCFRDDLVNDIMIGGDTSYGTDPEATIQKTFARSGSGCCGGRVACCRAMQKFSNYIVEFPKDATEEERLLLISAVLAQDYQLYEKQGGDK